MGVDTPTSKLPVRTSKGSLKQGGDKNINYTDFEEIRPPSFFKKYGRAISILLLIVLSGYSAYDYHTYKKGKELSSVRFEGNTPGVDGYLGAADLKNRASPSQPKTTATLPGYIKDRLGALLSSPPQPQDAYLYDLLGKLGSVGTQDSLLPTRHFTTVPIGINLSKQIVSANGLEFINIHDLEDLLQNLVLQYGEELGYVFVKPHGVANQFFSGGNETSISLRALIELFVGQPSQKLASMAGYEQGALVYHEGTLWLSLAGGTYTSLPGHTELDIKNITESMLYTLVGNMLQLIQANESEKDNLSLADVYWSFLKTQIQVLNNKGQPITDITDADKALILSRIIEGLSRSTVFRSLFDKQYGLSFPASLATFQTLFEAGGGAGRFIENIEGQPLLPNGNGTLQQSRLGNPIHTNVEAGPGDGNFGGAQSHNTGDGEMVPIDSDAFNDVPLVVSKEVSREISSYLEGLDELDYKEAQIVFYMYTGEQLNTTTLASQVGKLFQGTIDHQTIAGFFTQASSEERIITFFNHSKKLSELLSKVTLTGFYANQSDPVYKEERDISWRVRLWIKHYLKVMFDSNNIDTRTKAKTLQHHILVTFYSTIIESFDDPKIDIFNYADLIKNKIMNGDRNNEDT